MNIRGRNLACAVILANLLIVEAALGQGGGLEEVVVTAQKREQSLQDTPVAVSAFNSSALEQQGISDVHDIGYFIPNVQIVETAGSSTGAVIAIRGSVTFNPLITWESPVGIYLDGVFVGKNLGSIFDIVDLERIEVLRGPQGTLYGKNTIGGAINLITRKPSGEFGGKLIANAGNKDLYSIFASVDTPEVEMVGGSLKANVGLLRKERNGFIKNVPDPYNNPLANPPSGRDFGGIDVEAARFSALWEGFRTHINYSFDFSNTERTPQADQLTYVAPGAGLDIGGGIVLPIDSLLRPYLTSDSQRASAISNDQAFYEKSKVWGHALSFDWDAGNWGALGDVRLHSISALRKLDWADVIDIDGSPLDFFHPHRMIDYKQFSQEFRLNGNADRVDYVAGLYYFLEDGVETNPISFFAVYGFPIGFTQYGLDNRTLAAFGQVDWRPRWTWADNRLTLGLGVRWTREEKNQDIYYPNAIPAIPYTKGNDKWSNISPQFIATWALSDEINVYGKIANGWKAGGFNGEATSREAFLQAYDPEEVTSYEVGFKSRLWDNRLQINLAAFVNKLKDMQFTVYVGGPSSASTVDNAGKATIRGYELELLAQATEKLTISLSYGYLDTKYDEFLEVDPFTGVLADFKDSRDFPFAAKDTGNAGLEYSIGEFDWGTVTARIDWSHNGNYVPYVNPAQNATSQIKGYDLVNARLTLSDVTLGNGGKKMRIAAWGKNLTDKEYRVNTIPFGWWTVSYFGEPRSYGLEFSYEF